VLISGRYQILDWLQEDGESPIRKAKGLILKIATAGPHQMVIVTSRVPAPSWGEVLEACGGEDEGLPEDEIAEIEAIALDRSHFSRLSCEPPRSMDLSTSAAP
jgi:hypothetical protein